jgi:hypothetical protein
MSVYSARQIDTLPKLNAVRSLIFTLPNSCDLHLALCIPPKRLVCSRNGFSCLGLYRCHWKAGTVQLLPKTREADALEQNNPLHISLFPPSTRSLLDFSFILSSTLDIFDARLSQKLQPVDQDFGLLEAVDENLACYGWLTNTGVKFVAVVDMVGRKAPLEGELGLKGRAAVITGLRDSDLKPVSVVDSMSSR